MKNHSWKSTYSIPVALGGLGLLLMLSAPLSGIPPSTDGVGGTDRQLNQKALAASSGDAVAIQALTDEILVAHGLQQALASSPDVRDRLIRAELNYRSGRTTGIRELQIVRLINAWAKKLEAPTYGFTSLYEVRRVRMAILASTPALVFVAQEPVLAAASIKSEMSPLEAFHVAATLAYQKVYNPEYQVTNEERYAKWAEAHRRKGPFEGQQAPGERTQEILKHINREFSSGRFNIYRALHASLTLMGVAP